MRFKTMSLFGILSAVSFTQCKTRESSEGNLNDYANVQKIKQLSSGRWAVLCKDGSFELRSKIDIGKSRVCENQLDLSAVNDTPIVGPDGRMFTCALKKGERIKLAGIDVKYENQRGEKIVDRQRIRFVPSFKYNCTNIAGGNQSTLIPNSSYETFKSNVFISNIDPAQMSYDPNFAEPASYMSGDTFLKGSPLQKNLEVDPFDSPSYSSWD